MKRLFILTLIFTLLVPLPIAISPSPKNGSSTPQLSFNTEVIKEEFAEPLDSATLSSSSLPVVTPFWVDMVDAEVVSNDGEGVYVAVLDTGLLSVWPFIFTEANIAWELGKGFTHDFIWNPGDGDFEIGPLRDDRGFINHPWGSGHGTHVTSTIVGYDHPLGWIRGVAPEAIIIPVLVLDYWLLDCPDPDYPGCYAGKVFFRGGTDEMVSAGIEYIADLADTLDGPVIISMSLGGPEPSEMIEDAIDHAIEEGVIVVAAAGNAGYWGMDWPGAYPQVISCAAAGWTENWVPVFNRDFWLNDVPEEFNTVDYWGNNWHTYLEDFSSRPNKALGQKSFHLDVSTPGAAVVGPYQPFIYWDGSEWVMTPPGYYYVWGTSMATPHVSGIASHVLQDYPEVEQSKMEFILKNAAAGLPLPCDGAWVYDPWYGFFHFEWYGTEYGRGFLQSDAALKSAKNLN